MAWQNENLSDKLKEKIRAYVWSNLMSRRIVAQTADLYLGKVFSVLIAMLGGKGENDITNNGKSDSETEV